MVHVLNGIWLSHMDVQVLDIESLVSMTQNFFIGFYNLLNININKIVIGINVLFYKTLCLEKSWDKFPFFLYK